MNEKLGLRLLFSTYYKVNNDARNEMYYSKNNNNLIVFSPLDKSCDVDSICNGISNEAYLYLIKKLNEDKNIIIHWSQVEGTTSDYDIHINLKPEELKTYEYEKVIEVLSNSITTHIPTKYRIINEGGYSIPITREEMTITKPYEN